jgi:hypothetical protein
MTVSEYRDTYSWQAALELGPRLMSLAEELPAAEEMGLSFQLRQLMVELPAVVAADLIQDGTTRQTVALKLVATLELVDRVYPALDTAATRTAADNLVERLMGAGFDERATQQPEAPAPAPAAPIAPAPAPSTVQIIPTVDNTEPQDTDVQPDSVQ